MRSFPVDVASEALPQASNALVAIARAEASGAMTIRHVALSVSASSDGSSVTITPTPKGIWIFSEEGSRRHPEGWEIVPKNGRALRFPDGGFAVTAYHPGIAGRQTWTKAKTEMASAFPPIVNRVAVALWRKAVSG